MIALQENMVDSYHSPDSGLGKLDVEILGSESGRT